MNNWQFGWVKTCAIVTALGMGVMFIDEVFMAGNFIFILQVIPLSIIGFFMLLVGVPIFLIIAAALIILPLSPIILFVYFAMKMFE